MVDLCIRNARLRHKGDELLDIAVTDGRVADIGERLSVLAQDEIDAEGSLVTESFANPHLHLCKVWTLPMVNEAALAAYHGAEMGKALARSTSQVRSRPTTMPPGSRGMPAGQWRWPRSTAISISARLPMSIARRASKA